MEEDENCFEENMKKTLFFVSGNVVGGHEFQCKELILLAGKYSKVTVVFNNLQQYKSFKLDESIFSVRVSSFFHGRKVPLEFLSSIINFFKYFSLIRKHNQVVVSAGTVEASVGMFFLSMFKTSFLYIPMFVDRVVLWNSKWAIIYNCFLYLLILPFSKIITITDSQSLYFRKIKDTVVLPNRIEKKVSDERPFKSGKVLATLYFVGRIDDQQKRLAELIAWLDSAQNPYKVFYIAGDGPDLKLIKAAAEQTKYIEVIFLGWLDRNEQDNLFGESDVLILNSSYEGDPLVIREANERGSVVVARDIVGIRGCTHLENRYSNKEELLHLLNKAVKRELCLFNNLSLFDTDKIRHNVAKQIFF